MASHGRGNGSMRGGGQQPSGNLRTTIDQFAGLSMGEPRGSTRTTGYVSYEVMGRLAHRPGIDQGGFGTYLLEGNTIYMPDWVRTYVKQWMTKLQSARTYRSLVHFNAELKDCFSLSADPHWTALELVASGTGAAFASDCLLGFQAYLQIKPTNVPSMGDVKRFAFMIACRQEDSTIRDMIAQIFDLLRKPEIYIYAHLLKAEVAAKRYVAVARNATYFGLQTLFGFDQILVPLLMQNNFQEMEAYLDGCMDLQNKFVRYLDDFCNEDSKFAELVDSLAIPNMQRSRLAIKAMVKAVTRFVKRYNVSKDYFPTVSRTQAMSTISFLLHQFYDEDCIPEEDFADLLMDIVYKDPKLQLNLVNAMRNHDVAGSAWMARRLNIPGNKLPQELTIALDCGTARRPSRQQPASYGAPRSRAPRQLMDPIPYASWKSGEQYCGFPKYAPILPAVVHHVTDSAQFVEEVGTILHRTNIVAIDCEWKPTFDASPPRLSLLQMATDEVVLIVDILEIGPKMTNEHWTGFIELLSDPHMLKLGFGFKQDFVALACAHPALKDIASITKNLLQMDNVCRGILDEQPTLFPYYSGSGDASKQWRLGIIAELCLGVSLDKREQFSKWDRRPLRASQRDYAVADVHVLLDIFRVLQLRCREAKIYDLKQFLKTPATGKGDEN